MKIQLGIYESQLHAPLKVIKQLRLLMRVRIEGYQYTDAYERGWDGYKYYINNSGKFLTGLSMYVFTLLTKHYGKDSVTIIPTTDQRDMTIDFDYEVGNGWVLDGAQRAVVDQILNYTYEDGTVCTHGVIDAAVGFGKTSVFASLVRNFKDKKFIILCDTTLVFNQTVKFFFDIYGEEEIGIIQGKTIRLRRVTIAMVQSLRNKINKEISSYFDFVISDECHGLSNKTGKSILSKLQAPYRYFFSGTPYDHGKQSSKVEMIGLSGYPIARVKNIENQERGRTLRATVNLHKITYPTLPTGKEYLRYLTMSTARNQRIADIVEANQDKKILIVCKFTEHCEQVYKHLKGVMYTHGSDPNKADIINRFKKDPTGKLLTTFIIKQGVNIPDIQLLIVAFGGADEISVKQVAGRVIRDDDLSQEVEIHDFYDEGGNLEDHSKSRIKYYQKEGYTIKKLFNE